MDQVISATGLRKQYFRKGRDQARYFDAVADVDIELRAGELVKVTKSVEKQLHCGVLLSEKLLRPV